MPDVIASFNEGLHEDLKDKKCKGMEENIF